jgi:hypothetical protein
MRLPQESLDKIAKVIFNKVKCVKTPISGSFGEGDIVITKVRCENYGMSNMELIVSVRYTQTRKESNWRYVSPQWLGRRRNDKIKTMLQYTDNHEINSLAKVFGAKFVNVEKITVKK